MADQKKQGSMVLLQQILDTQLILKEQIEELKEQLNEITIIVNQNSAGIATTNASLSNAVRSTSSKSSTIKSTGIVGFPKHAQLWLRKKITDEFEPTLKKYFPDNIEEMNNYIEKIKSDNAGKETTIKTMTWKYIWGKVAEKDITSLIQSDFEEERRIYNESNK